MTARERYAAILRAPHVARLMAAALVARMPIGIDALAIVLFLRERTGSYAQAGIVAAAFALGGGAGAPVSGRLIDRFGHRRVLLPLALAHAAGLGALVLLGVAGAPLGALVAAALAGGAAIPPISAVLRPLWPGLLRADPGLIPTAYALDAVLIELVFVVGPLLTALATAVLSPAAAIAPLAAASSLAVMVVLCVVAGLAIAPLLAVANQLIGDVAPAGALTEAYTWPITALVVGLALGNGAAGGLVEAADWRVAFLAASAGAGAGALVAFARRGTLLPAPVRAAA